MLLLDHLFLQSRFLFEGRLIKQCLNFVLSVGHIRSVKRLVMGELNLRLRHKSGSFFRVGRHINLVTFPLTLPCNGGNKRITALYLPFIGIRFYFDHARSHLLRVVDIEHRCVSELLRFLGHPLQRVVLHVLEIAEQLI